MLWTHSRPAVAVGQSHSAECAESLSCVLQAMSYYTAVVQRSSPASVFGTAIRNICIVINPFQ